MERIMGRGSDPDDTGAGGMFRTSRRVNFVVRAGSPARRFSSSRVSRDPMQSLSVDVEAAKPATVDALGLEDDWSRAIAPLTSGTDTTEISLLRVDDGETLRARARVRNTVVYISADEPGLTPDAPVASIGIGRDLFSLVRSRRAAIGVAIGSTNGARLVSFQAVTELLESDGVPQSVQPTTPHPEQPPAPATEDAPEATHQADPPDPQPQATQIVPRDEPDAPAVPQPDAAPGALRIRALTSPRGFPDSIQERLARRLAALESGIGTVMLFQVEYSDGNAEYLLGVAGAPHDRETEIEDAVNRALSESRRNVDLGITFMAADDPLLPRISRVGLTLG